MWEFIVMLFAGKPFLFGGCDEFPSLIRAAAAS
jgi:hypothetical protein